MLPPRDAQTAAEKTVETAAETVASLTNGNLPLRTRWSLAFAAGVLAFGLGVAAWMEPDRRGYGTHEHLGLGPCTFRVLFNRPCPSCGMTTSWTYMARGRLTPALRANAGGTLLAIMAILATPWLIASAALGRWLFGPPSDLWIALAAGTIGVVTLVQWLARLFLA